MPTRTPRIAAAATLAVAALIGTSACATSSSSSSDSVSGQTITYWATNNGSSVSHDQKLLEKEAAKFTKSTGVEVDVEVVPWSDLLTRIQTAITTGQGPDVVNIGNTWAASLQATGAFLPIDDSVIKQIGGWDRYAKPALTANGDESKTPISIPLYNFVDALYYNKSVLAKAGIDTPPTTWDELATDAEKVQSSGSGVSGIGLQPGTDRVPLIYANQLDGKVLSGKDPDLTDPALVSALQADAAWWGTDGVVDKSNLEYTAYTDVVQRLVDGKIGFALLQTGEQTFTNLGLDDSEYGVTKLPTVSDAPTAGADVTATVGGSSVAILKNTKHEQASIEFVEFLSSASESTTLSHAFGATSPVLAAQKSDVFDTPVQRELASILNSTAKGSPQIAAATALETALNTAVKTVETQAVTKGSVSKADVEAALAKAQDQFEAAR